MKQNIVLIAIIIVMALVIGAGATYIYLDRQNTPTSVQISPTPIEKQIPTSTPVPIEVEPTQMIEESLIPSGWQTYVSSEYNFEISYPTNYQALDDENNLYGWPNGVVLLYGGGQSYDIAIEAWGSEGEYQTKYPSGTLGLSVYKIDADYITILDQTQAEDNTEIISTFNPTN